MHSSVLIADSDPELLELLEEYLSEQGFSVVTASGALDCMIELRRSPPDVLLLDWDLQWGGGDGVLARLRVETDIPAMSVVLMTSSAVAELPQEPGGKARLSYLRKPFLADCLLESLFDAAVAGESGMAIGTRRSTSSEGASWLQQADGAIANEVRLRHPEVAEVGPSREAN
jgi:DNA-binding response OmpR family regulator